MRMLPLVKPGDKVKIVSIETLPNKHCKDACRNHKVLTIKEVRECGASWMPFEIGSNRCENCKTKANAGFEEVSIKLCLCPERFELVGISRAKSRLEDLIL